VSMQIARPLVAEFTGTAFLLIAVVGTGILAHQLDQGNLALAVLSVAVATGATLLALILSLSHISSHFNPVVTLALAIRREFKWSWVLPYIAAQILGACAGVMLSNLMFDLPLATISDTARHAPGQYLGEFIATFGLLGVIFGAGKGRPDFAPFAVAGYVLGAIYFTSSTCFANPAVTISRMFTATLTGIAPADVPGYIAAQLVALASALVFFGWLNKPVSAADDSDIRARLERELVQSSTT
jgi:glycerol uptake facilitator-like aquaporin